MKNNSSNREHHKEEQFQVYTPDKVEQCGLLSCTGWAIDIRALKTIKVLFRT